MQCVKRLLLFCMHQSCVNAAGEIAKELVHALVTSLKANTLTFAALVLLGPWGLSVWGDVCARDGSGPRWCFSTQERLLGSLPATLARRCFVSIVAGIGFNLIQFCFPDGWIFESALVEFLFHRQLQKSGHA